jgi:hypothetical protein
MTEQRGSVKKEKGERWKKEKKKRGLLLSVFEQ